MGRLPILSVIVVVFLLCAVDCKYSPYYMDQKCGSLLFMNQGSILLDLTANSKYSRHMNCSLTVKSTKAYMYRMMVKVLSLNIESTALCEADSLKIYDGRSTASRPLTGYNGICGSIVPFTIYKTSGYYMTLKFKSDLTLQAKGFQILITGFDDSRICLPLSQYQCDNTYCIAKSLQCDGYNNCGDNSDEENCYTTTTYSYIDWPTIPRYTGMSFYSIAGITFGCIAGVIVLVVVVVGLAGRNSNGSRTAPGQTRTAGTNRAYISTEQPCTEMRSPGQVPTGQYPQQNNLPPAYDVLFSTADQTMNAKS